MPDMFELKYKPDPGLEFLQFCSRDEMQSLTDLLIQTGGFSTSIEIKSRFSNPASRKRSEEERQKKYEAELKLSKNPEDERKIKQKYESYLRFKKFFCPSENWKIIAAELQNFGGHTISNLARTGEGVIYEEILRDACSSMEIKKEENSLPSREVSVLIRCLEKVECLEEAIDTFNVRKRFTVSPDSMPQAFEENAFSENPLPFEVGLCFMKKIILFAKEHESKMNGIFSGSTAFRVTIPAIIQIGYLRKVVMSRNIL